MPETVAVQLTSDAVVLARAESSGAERRVTEIVRRPLDEAEDGRQVAIELIRERGVENIGLALVVNWKDYSIRETWLPFTSPSQLRSTIKYELEDDLDREADTLIMPFQMLEQRPDSSHVLAWPTSRETVSGLLQPLESVGISPEYMPPDAIGHVGLVRGLAPDLAEEPLVVVSGDDRDADLTLLVGSTVWARRRLPGFAWATDAAGAPLQELRRTLLATPGFPEPAAVVTFGGEAADTLGRIIADDLGCEHRSVNPPGQDIGGDGRAWPLAAGVALMLAASDQRPLTFRLEEFEPKETAQVVSLLSVVAVGLLGICFMTAGFIFFLKTDQAKERTATCQTVAAKFWQDYVGQSWPGMGQFQVRLESQLKTLRERQELAAQRVDAAELWRDLTMALSGVPAKVSLDLRDIDVARDGINLEGTVNSAEAATDLKNHLDASNRFTAQVRNIDPQESGRARFDIRLTTTN